MTPTRVNRFLSHGGSFAPVIMILVALAISAAIFFLVTKKRIDEGRQKPVAGTVTAPSTPGGTGSSLPKPPSQSAPITPPAAPVMPPAPLGFARPVDVAEQLARTLGAGDLPAAARIIAGGDATQEANALAVLSRLKDLGYEAAAAEQVQTIGQVGSSIRLGIPLAKADGTGATRIQIDVLKDPKMGWKVGSLRLPKELEGVMAGIVQESVAPPPNAPPVVNPAGGAPVTPASARTLFMVDSQPDAISFAHDFVQALLKLQYESVNKLVDESRVPPMKIAGLCIVFEEGKYTLASQKPLVATIAGEKTSWVIAKVQSDLLKGEETEFGLELEKTPGGWRVIGLNLSKFLADNARASAAAGVPYTPLVQNPKGGESIALYYEYDSDVLHPRAQTQLKIIGGILKSSPTKMLKIGGHTDALGDDSYNLNLSRKRAEAVKKYLLAEGVPVGQVQTVGFGKANPLSPNANADGTDNPVGRSRNRRAEILLDF